MSLGTETSAEMEADFAVYEGKTEESARLKVWTTKKGRRIPYNQMSDFDIENTIAMLERNNDHNIYNSLIHEFKKELRRRRNGV